MTDIHADCEKYAEKLIARGEDPEAVKRWLVEDLPHREPQTDREWKEHMIYYLPSEEKDKLCDEEYYFACWVKQEKIEENWWKSQLKVREDVRALKEEMKKDDPDFVRDCRMAFLEPRMKILVDEIWELGCLIENWKTYGEFGKLMAEGKNAEELKKLQGAYKRYYLEYGMLKGGIPLRENEITPETIQACREVPVETLIAGRIVNAGGGRKKTLCIFHAEKTPSFVIYADNSWHCFGCNTSGQNAIDFIMQREKIDFLATVNYLRQYS